MRERPLDLENLRLALELSVQRAEATALHLSRTGATRAQIHDAQDEWSDAVANLAAYLLATGEAGWVGVARLPAYASLAAAESRPM